MREENTAVAHLPFDPQISFAPLFYAFTDLVPLAYLYYDMRSHDRLLLVVDLLAMTFSVFTLRYYAPCYLRLWPPRKPGPCYWPRYLRTPRHGLTAAADDEARPAPTLKRWW